MVRAHMALSCHTAAIAASPYLTVGDTSSLSSCKRNKACKMKFVSMLESDCTDAIEPRLSSGSSPQLQRLFATL
jgi:hypothetical protein